MALLGGSGAAVAHVVTQPHADPAAGTLPGWVFEPWVVACLVVSLALYVAGVARLWRHAGRGRGVHPRDVGWFGAGWLALAAAMVTPLDPLGARLFSAHMVQHELLMVVAAPMLVLGRPLAAWTWALSPPARRAAQRLTHGANVRRAWRWLTAPLPAWLLHAAALWVWHVPRLFDAALAHEGLHALQHVCFLGTALLFWWAVLKPMPRSQLGRALLLLFTTMLHTGALGALLALSPTLWYASYRHAGLTFGLDALSDQQLGGLLMWVPAGLLYAAIALMLIARCLAGPGDPASARVGVLASQPRWR